VAGATGIEDITMGAGGTRAAAAVNAGGDLLGTDAGAGDGAGGGGGRSDGGKANGFTADKPMRFMMCLPVLAPGAVAAEAMEGPSPNSADADLADVAAMRLAAMWDAVFAAEMNSADVAR
jgi:hypothetical protein